MLTSLELLDPLEDLLPDHRERLYPPTGTLSMFLAQALRTDRSLALPLCVGQENVHERQVNPEMIR